MIQSSPVFHWSWPFVRWNHATTPPDPLVRTAGHIGGRKCTVPGWMPLACQSWRKLAERPSAHAFTSAFWTACSRSHPHANFGVPDMIRICPALPPDFDSCKCADGLRGSGEVPRRVPLLCQLGCSHRQRSRLFPAVRASRILVGSTANLRGPFVVGVSFALPPDSLVTSGCNCEWIDSLILCGMPLLE